MMSVTGRIPTVASFTQVALIAACAFVLSAGCDRRPSTAERAKQAREEAHMSSVTVYPLAGKVTVDNQTPSFTSKRTAIVVMAYDASKPNVPTAEQPFVMARPDGSFEFPDGGLPPGKYVMLFAALDLKKKNARAGDGLKNLFNDPEVNGKKPEFTINHEAPGKTDYAFNLNVAGETPPAQAGPKSLIQLPK
ncbi:MAG TPA: hypothetical protein VG055_15205 [Planctomycetaceae bacterium]|jgi:hypothetical protein|nr:hypothetical protein [Planctomycetaceae bacterium]